LAKKTWNELLEFIKEAKKNIPKVVITVVEGYQDVDIDKCQKIADTLKVDFRKRTYYK